jgi:hypothetical protein
MVGIRAFLSYTVGLSIGLKPEVSSQPLRNPMDQLKTLADSHEQSRSDHGLLIRRH